MNMDEIKKSNDIKRMVKINNNSDARKNIKCSIRIESVLQDEIKKLTDQCNKKSYGKTIVAQDIISFSIKLLKKDHLKKIIEASYSIQDKITLDCIEHNKKNECTLSYDQYLAMKLKIQ